MKQESSGGKNNKKYFKLINQTNESMHQLHKRHLRRKHNPFWQANMPYIHESNISFTGFRWLGYIMAFLGGAINAGGFFAVMRYTSHMSGELSQIGDNIFLSEWRFVLVSTLLVVSFILGAAHSSWTIIWAKQNRFRSSYGISMWMEALYMLFFGAMGAGLSKYGVLLSPTAMLLAFIMGMHNTVMTILSNGVVRSTHMTGFVTDIGIELSKVMHMNKKNSKKQKDLSMAKINIPKIKLFAGVVLSFVLGGALGAWIFHQIGFYFVFPVAFVLFVIGFNSIGYDVRLRLRIWVIKRYIRNQRQNS